MAWWGKLLGGTFGFMLGGPLGALLGAALGHNLDRGLQGLGVEGAASHERVQMAFFTATFAVMGRLAKADGRVSEDEIAFARSVMTQMRLNGEQRELAIELFRRGKSEDFDLDGVLDQLRHECRRRLNLMRMFLEIQMQAAFADGKVDPDERRLLLHVFERLGFSRADYEHLEAMASSAHYFHGGGAGTAGPAPEQLLDKAYAVLGVSAQAGDDEVKRAYRRLMNQHHPDKLVARGLPEEMLKLATEKAQEIKAAYETVKQARSMR